MYTELEAFFAKIPPALESCNNRIVAALQRSDDRLSRSWLYRMMGHRPEIQFPLPEETE